MGRQETSKVLIRRAYYGETFVHKTFVTTKSVDSPGGSCRFRVIYRALRRTRRLGRLVRFFRARPGVMRHGRHVIICLGRNSRVISLLGIVRTCMSLVGLRGMEVLGRVHGSIGHGMGYRATGVGGAIGTTIGRVRSVGEVQSAVKFSGVPRPLTRVTRTHLSCPRTALGRLKACLSPPIKGSNIGRELQGLTTVTRGLVWEKAACRPRTVVCFWSTYEGEASWGSSYECYKRSNRNEV